MLVNLRKMNPFAIIIGTLRLATCSIIGLLTLSALFLAISCLDAPAETQEDTRNFDVIRDPAVKATMNTKNSENQSNLLHGSADETINIGLIVSSQVSKSELARSASDGAELAVQQANMAGGYDHRCFRLLVRSCDGPWGMAAKEAVSLITESRVAALLTSLDGRNAHLIEQVATKTKVIMLSARATDPTLSQAFVPWYFRCVPDDNLQAEALAGELVKRIKMNHFIVVSENSYDSRLASGSFMKKLKEMAEQLPVQFFYDQLKPDFSSLTEQIKNTGINNIVLFGGPENSLRLLKRLTETGKEHIIFGPFSVMGEKNNLKEFWNYTDHMVLTSVDFWFTPDGNKFQEVFYKTYGYLPGPLAAFAYDGMNILIEAIKMGGLEQEKTINSLAKIKYEGVTGTIQFDDKGNRKGKPDFIEIVRGKPVPVRINNEALK